MYPPGVPRELTTGAIVAAGEPRTTLKGCVLTGGSDAAVATIKQGGSGGTVVLTIKAPINTTVVVPICMEIQDPYLTLTGTVPTFTAFL